MCFQTNYILRVYMTCVTIVEDKIISRESNFKLFYIFCWWQWVEEVTGQCMFPTNDRIYQQRRVLQKMQRKAAAGDRAPNHY